MIEIVIFFVGCTVTWLITHSYYKRSLTTIPEWAKPIVEHLPKKIPTKDELLQLFQEHLDTGEVEVDPLLGRVSCPECGESSKNFKKTGFGDDSHYVVVISCPSCGWSESVEV